jgi:DNA repair exonuclease SbcCD ATPase subunit
MNLLVKQRAQENKEKLENTRVVMRSTTEKKDYIEKTLASLRQTNDDRLAELEKQYQDLAQQKKDIISDVEKIVAEKKQLQDEVNDLSEIKKQFHDTVKLYTQFDTEAKRLDAEKEMLKTTDNCPTCKQTIEKSFKSQRVLDLGNTISGLVVQATTTEGQSNILLAEISNKENQVKRIQAISAEISAKKQTMMHLVSTMNDIEDSIDKIKNADKLVQNSEEDLLKTVGEIERIEGVIKFQMTERVMIDTASALLKDGGIKTKIIKQYIPIINKLVNKYLDRMGFFVNFNIDENFNEVIKSRYRDEFAYANFSEGEKTRIDLALMFTWRSIAKMKNSVNTNLLILDEILDGSLDANGTDEFLKIIKTLTDDTNTYIISHKTDTIADKFDKTYRFEKIRNFSRLMT